MDTHTPQLSLKKNLKLNSKSKNIFCLHRKRKKAYRLAKSKLYLFPNHIFPSFTKKKILDSFFYPSRQFHYQGIQSQEQSYQELGPYRLGLLISKMPPTRSQHPKLAQLLPPTSRAKKSARQSNKGGQEPHRPSNQSSANELQEDRASGDHLVKFDGSEPSSTILGCYPETPYASRGRNTMSGGGQDSPSSEANINHNLNMVDVNTKSYSKHALKKIDKRADEIKNSINLIYDIFYSKIESDTVRKSCEKTMEDQKVFSEKLSKLNENNLINFGHISSTIKEENIMAQKKSEHEFQEVKALNLDNNQVLINQMQHLFNMLSSELNMIKMN
ncbi:hypothetical protein VP01_1295g2 [Puccinia sorghi]|uniref:Uncharacterized protein n=1 Tax=Puccinia sorghi TaxID=27349 RepID=A0A0L6VNG8_9BASI|nr:hypothetical protein VP01_1295g2 [Puccinia sorghi]